MRSGGRELVGRAIRRRRAGMPYSSVGSRPQTERESTVKDRGSPKQYEAPELIVLGSVWDVTRGFHGFHSDHGSRADPGADVDDSSLASHSGPIGYTAAVPTFAA